jgi:hypothetical protein
MATPNTQICASYVLTGIEAISAPNGGSARGYQEFRTVSNPDHGRAGRRPVRMFMHRQR